MKSKFNGGEVMHRYGFKGKELGEIMKSYKTYVESNISYKRFSMNLETFEEFIIGGTIDMIYEDFEDYLLTLKK